MAVATELLKSWQLASVFGAKDCFTTPPTSEGTRVACAPRAPCRALSSAGARHQTLLRGLLVSRHATTIIKGNLDTNSCTQAGWSASIC